MTNLNSVNVKYYIVLNSKHSMYNYNNKDYLDSSELWILLALGICLAILILSLSIGGIVCWRKWGRHLKDLEWKSRKLRE